MDKSRKEIIKKGKKQSKLQNEQIKVGRAEGRKEGQKEVQEERMRRKYELQIGSKKREEN